MKQIALVGIGMSAATTTMEAQAAIHEADMLLGAKRMVDAFAGLGKRSRAVYQPDEVAATIETSDAQRFAVLVSGDVGFYSGASGLYERLKEYDITLVPGVSSVSYFFAKCGLSWQDAALVSCHGAAPDLVGAVRRNRLTFALTGSNVRALAENLCSAGFSALPVRVGENLGLPEERVSEATVSTLREKDCAALTVLLIENESYDPRVRTGIPDTEF
jgi:precorrin-6Y C5,15-methyltransferase (decarboxylating)